MEAYWSLVRPRIMAMVLLAMTAAAWTAAGHWPGAPLLHALLGTAAVIAGAVALNQRLEFSVDGKMARTAGRPLPSGRLTDRQVTRFGLLASAAGVAYLLLLTNSLLSALAVVSWLLYVWAYTPLKSVTIWQTPIGAIAGAMPVLLGAAAVGAPASPVALVLFGIVYFWQFPHSMAIAWLYREQFAAAEVKVATVVDPTGRTAGRLAVFGAAVLLPLSLLPLAMGSRGVWGYAVCAVVLGCAYLAASIDFLRCPRESSARRLLRTSLVYLPLLLAALLLLAPRSF